MDYLYTILEKIKNHPELYIGKKSIQKLADFINGYICAIFEITGKKVFFGNFKLYIEYKSGISHPGQHWSDILSNNKSQEDAFDLFYIYLEEFKVLIKNENDFQNLLEMHSKMFFK